MKSNSKKHPIIIVGMARSGTTLVSHILGTLPGTHIEVEPHALWKSGNFKYLNDEDYDINEEIIHNIRHKLTTHLNGNMLVEKSPINSLRPNLVHAVFPEAKIVYIERDPVRCIHSNYNRSLKKDSFKLSIVLKKYFIYTGSEDLSGAISNRKLFQQISFKDIPQFLKYSVNMFYLRQFSVLPFGPKVKNFVNIVKEKGLLGYHVEVYKKSIYYKQLYKDLYGDKMEVFRMEKIMTDKSEIKRMIDFANMPYTKEWGDYIQHSLNKDRIDLAVKTQWEVDSKIEQLLVTS